MIDRRPLRAIRAQVSRYGVEDEDLLSPAPYLIGAPEKFKSWRPGQWSGIVRSMDSDKRVVIHCKPTGSGKTLSYVAEALLRGERAIILTSTKGLQDQLWNDFESIGLSDIRGRGNYTCLALEPDGELRHLSPGTHGSKSVDDGPCWDGVYCSLKQRGCEYFDLLRKAQRAQIVSTNYALWMTLNNMPPELRFDQDVGLLVLDEAHYAPDEVCGHLSIELKEDEIRWVKRELNYNIDVSNYIRMGLSYQEQDHQLLSWRSIGMEVSLKLQILMESLRQSGEPHHGHHLKSVRSLLRKMTKIGQMSGEWVIQTQDQQAQSRQATRGSGGQSTMITFDPVWPQPYAEALLFRSIPKIILSSATVRLKTADLLGLRSEAIDLQESSSLFPKERRYVYHIPAIQMNHRNETDEVKIKWLIRRIDQIIQMRQDRRGIIHTVSYKRRDYVLTMSRFSNLMISHDTRTARTVIEAFKSGSSKPILVSPSVSTGYDFPYRQCEYQIILKIPFLDTRNMVTKRRCQEDKEYDAYSAIQEIVQMTGRGMRAADDQCETFILDDNAAWFLPKWKRKDFIPRWWYEAYQGTVEVIPAPPPKLTTITTDAITTSCDQY